MGVVQLKNRIAFTLFPAKLLVFPLKIPIIFVLYLHALKCYAQIRSLFPHWPKRQVSLIWSRRGRADGTSPSDWVTADLPCWRRPLSFGHKPKEKEKGKIPRLLSCLGENGGEIFGLICYCVEHTTVTFVVYLW